MKYGKLTDLEVQNLIDQYVSGETSIDLASKYGINRAHTTEIIRGNYFKHLKRPDNILELIKIRTYKKHLILPQLTEHQNNIVVGSLLGDGYVTKPNGTYGESRFNKQQKNREHLDWISKELDPYSCSIVPIISKKKLISNSGKPVHINCDPYTECYRFGTITNPVFTNFRQKWYREKKIVPRDLILNPEILAIWYIDDGSCTINKRVYSIATHNFSFEEVEFLCSLLKNTFGIKGTIQKQNKMPRLAFYSDNYDTFFDIIKPFNIWDYFNYKFNHYNYKIKRKLNDSQKANILNLFNKGYSVPKIRDSLNISYTTIWKFIKNIKMGI